jgi:hypothetical protein
MAMRSGTHLRNLVVSAEIRWFLFILAVILLNWPLLGITRSAGGPFGAVALLFGGWSLLILVLLVISRITAARLLAEKKKARNDVLGNEGSEVD